MAGEQTTNPGAQVRTSDLISQYELGDSSPANPPSPEDSGGKPPVPASAPEPGALSSQLRRPDGTFGKKHPQYLVQQALDLGISDQEIADTETEVLGQSVRYMTRQAMAIQRERADQATVHEAMDRGRARVPEPPEPEPPSELGLDESIYDAGLMGVLRAQQKRINQLEGHLRQLATSHQAQLHETIQQKFDRAFAGLGQEYGGLLGKGSVSDLSAQSSELARRRVVIAEAMRLAGQNASADVVAQKIGAAAKLLFGQAATPRPPEPAETREHQAWREAGLQLPTNRQSSEEPKGVRRAERAVAQYQRDSVQANGVQAEDDDFPE